jgi:EAL domain-containing protein (putative c-di-GMP-specific phosphodiesterase class I)
VETADDAAALRTLGVDFGQGWHFGRPGPPEALAVPVPRTPAADAAPEPVLSR